MRIPDFCTTRAPARRRSVSHRGGLITTPPENIGFKQTLENQRSQKREIAEMSIWFFWESKRASKRFPLKTRVYHAPDEGSDVPVFVLITCLLPSNPSESPRKKNSNKNRQEEQEEHIVRGKTKSLLDSNRGKRKEEEERGRGEGRSRSPSPMRGFENWGGVLRRPFIIEHLGFSVRGLGLLGSETITGQPRPTFSRWARNWATLAHHLRCPGLGFELS